MKANTNLGIFIIPLLTNLVVNGYDLHCNTNLVYYWGQNSYGGAHPNQPDQWEGDLARYCDQAHAADVINLSFLNVFNAGNKDKLPEINFANHCADFFPGTNLRTCPKIGEDIKYCQQRNKTLILSLGGAIANTGFPNADAAADFGLELWDMFFNGKHKYRPFGDAVIDGIDLDLEGGSQDHYTSFLAALQGRFKSDPNRKYYITAAPQCEFPDRNLNHIIDNNYLDAIFIQFYNNWCGVHNYENPWAFNYNTWDKWARMTSKNSNVKLYLGVPASVTAAGSGYVGLDKLKRIIHDIRSDYSKNFGGVMLWDMSQSEHNLVDGKKTFGKAIKEILLDGGDCKETPPTLPEPTTTSSTTKPTQTSTTSTTQTSTETTTSTSTDNPKPTDAPPIKDGQPCQSEPSTCSGDKLAVCNHGKWLLMNCPANTVCKLSNQAPYCGFPDSKNMFNIDITTTYKRPRQKPFFGIFGY